MHLSSLFFQIFIVNCIKNRLLIYSNNNSNNDNNNNGNGNDNDNEHIYTGRILQMCVVACSQKRNDEDVRNK